MICDGCQATEITETSSEELDGKAYSLDEWDLGIPDGWLQIPLDKITGKRYLFFHDAACYKKWLESQGRIQEAASFNNIVWIA